MARRGSSHVKVSLLQRTRMRLILVVFLTIVLHRLSLSFTAPTCTAKERTSSLDPCNPTDWVRFRVGIVPEGPKKPSAFAKSMTAAWTSTTGLCKCQHQVRERLDVTPEWLKQSPIIPESVASSLSYPSCQFWNHLLPWHELVALYSQATCGAAQHGLYCLLHLEKCEENSGTGKVMDVLIFSTDRLLGKEHLEVVQIVLQGGGQNQPSPQGHEAFLSPLHERALLNQGTKDNWQNNQDKTRLQGKNNANSSNQGKGNFSRRRLWPSTHGAQIREFKRRRLCKRNK